MKAAWLLAPIVAVTAIAQGGSKPTQLTAGGCCVDAFWSPDSQRVLYLDKPPGATTAAIYAVPVGNTGVQKATVAFSRVAWYSPDLRYAVIPQGDTTLIERLSDRARFTVPGGGNVLWSPDGKQVAWTVQAQNGNYDARISRVYVAPLFGTPRLVKTAYGGGVTGWLGNSALLINGKTTQAASNRSLTILDLDGGGTRTLASAWSIRGATASPGGKRVAYYIAFDQPGRNGMFLADTTSGRSRKLDLFGSYRWRSATQLLFIPLEPGRATHRLVELDAATGESRQLLDLGTKVQDDNWDVSPDGKRIVFLNARDRNLYWLDLPG